MKDLCVQLEFYILEIHKKIHDWSYSYLGQCDQLRRLAPTDHSSFIASGYKQESCF